MARDDERDRVRADGAADRAGGARISDRSGNILIGRQAAERNLEERLPDLDLEVRASEVEPQWVAAPACSRASEHALREKRCSISCDKAQPTNSAISRTGSCYAGLGWWQPASPAPRDCLGRARRTTAFRLCMRAEVLARKRPAGPATGESPSHCDGERAVSDPTTLRRLTQFVVHGLACSSLTAWRHGRCRIEYA